MFQSEKIHELDLNNPIFVVYLNVQNKSRQSSQEYIEETQKYLDIYKNATMWFVKSNKDEIVCVYDGWGRVRDSELKDLIEEINTKIEILSNSNSFDDFKINVRDWRLGKLIDDKDN
jgi:Uma2 family endonuclease